MKRSRHVLPGDISTSLPSLWGDHTAERGVQLLAALDFAGADQALNACLKDQSLAELAQKEPAAAAAIKAVRFWQPLINNPKGGQHEQDLQISWADLNNLVNTYANYDFGKWLSSFASNLLCLLTNLADGLLQKMPSKQLSSQLSSQRLCPEQVYITIELLCQLLPASGNNLKRKNLAIQLLLNATAAFPIDGRLYYLLTAAYFQRKKRSEALRQYTYNLLYFPAFALGFASIYSYLPTAFVQLLKSLPPAKAVAIGVMQDLLPLLTPPQLPLSEPSDIEAMQCYQAFYQAEQSRKKNEALNIQVRHRKNIVLADKIIGEKYLEYIKGNTL